MSKRTQMITAPSSFYVQDVQPAPEPIPDRDMCRVCGRRIVVMCFIGTGYCCELCQDAAEGKKEHPRVVPT